MEKFNLNSYILIQITEYGWEYLLKEVGQEYITHCILSYKQEVNGEVYYQLQAHQIISVFGNAIWAAYPSPINPNILIP